MWKKNWAKINRRFKNKTNHIQRIVRAIQERV